MKVNLEHISYSSLNLFLECQRCWYLKYVHGYPLPVPPAWNFGGDVHKAIQTYHLTGKKPKDPATLLLLNDYFKLYKPEDYDETELRFNVDIRHPVFKKQIMEVPLQVVIDRVWRNWIFETKTSSRKYTQEMIEGRTQTSLYAYAYRTHYEKEEKGIRYDVLVKSKVPTMQTLDTHCSENDINAALDWIWKTWQQIKEAPEPKVHSPNCYRKNILP